MGFDIWYENPYLDTVHRQGMEGVNPTPAESRISLLYNLLERRIMPWMWDTENYMDDNKDMYGYFYPEDFNTVLQIAYFESRKKRK